MHLFILCTFSRFGESGFGESGLNLCPCDESFEDYFTPDGSHSCRVVV